MKCCERQDLLLPTNPRILCLAEKLRKQLLQFRFLNYKMATLPTISGEAELHPRTRDIFRCLALPLHEEKEICEGLLLILKEQQSVRHMLSEKQSAVLDFLFGFIHTYTDIDGLLTSYIAKKVNAILQERGEPGKLSDKKVGTILTSINLMNRTRTNSGYVLWFNRETRKEIHLLARRHGAKTGPNSELAAKCDICQAANADSTDGPTIKPAEGGNRAPENFSTGKHNKRRVRARAKGPKPAHSARAGKPRRRS
jgi:hypothetical protein